jgi:hypothetical protein
MNVMKGFEDGTNAELGKHLIQKFGGVVMNESPARVAAIQLTAYLRSLGNGAAGRGRENKQRVSQWLTQIGTPDPRGYYGRIAARRVAQLGLVPVVPYYWSRDTVATEKAEWLEAVAQYAEADPRRAAEWMKLAADSRL